MAKNGPKWPKMAQNGPKMAPKGQKPQKPPKMPKKDPKMAKMCQIGVQKGHFFARGYMGNRVLGTDQSFT